MLIVNADDWGRSREETDAAWRCFEQARITSVSAMVFMEDSQRAAELAGRAGMDVGLHLNLTQRFSGPVPSGVDARHHDRVVRFLTSSKYALLVYNPALVSQFRYDFESQLAEFRRLYGREPSHIDGHHHQHLCTNILLGTVIPKGARVRRNFHFWPGEKSRLNRAYRRLGDALLGRRYRLTDYFFALSHCIENDRMRRVCTLAKSATVEIMTHPAKAVEYNYLMSDAYLRETRYLQRAGREPD
jgi:predicted glycoside hydrolase/deacetylase ChbG (UPF0249 family)